MDKNEKQQLEQIVNTLETLFTPKAKNVFSAGTNRLLHETLDSMIVNVNFGATIEGLDIPLSLAIVQHKGERMALVLTNTTETTQELIALVQKLLKQKGMENFKTMAIDKKYNEFGELLDQKGIEIDNLENPFDDDIQRD